MTRLHVHIDDALYKRLKRAAFEQETSMGALVALALEASLGQAKQSSTPIIPRPDHAIPVAHPDTIAAARSIPVPRPAYAVPKSSKPTRQRYSTEPMPPALGDDAFDAV